MPNLNLAASSGADFYGSENMATCACGSPPNPDCERCQLVGEIERLKAEVERWKQHFDDLWEYRQITITARRKLRSECGELGEPEQFVLLDGLYYPLAWIKSGQPLRVEQLEVL